MSLWDVFTPPATAVGARPTPPEPPPQDDPPPKDADLRELLGRLVQRALRAQLAGNPEPEIPASALAAFVGHAMRAGLLDTPNASVGQASDTSWPGLSQLSDEQLWQLRGLLLLAKGGQ